MMLLFLPHTGSSIWGQFKSYNRHRDYQKRSLYLNVQPPCYSEYTQSHTEQVSSDRPWPLNTKEAGKMEIRRGNHRLEYIVLQPLCPGTGIWLPKGVQLRQGGCLQESGGLGEGLRQLLACERVRMPGMEQASGQHPHHSRQQWGSAFLELRL